MAFHIVMGQKLIVIGPLTMYYCSENQCYWFNNEFFQDFSVTKAIPIKYKYLTFCSEVS